MTLFSFSSLSADLVLILPSFISDFSGGTVLNLFLLEYSHQDKRGGGIYCTCQDCVHDQCSDKAIGFGAFRRCLRCKTMESVCSRPTDKDVDENFTRLSGLDSKLRCTSTKSSTASLSTFHRILALRCRTVLQILASEAGLVIQILPMTVFISEVFQKNRECVSTLYPLDGRRLFLYSPTKMFFFCRKTQRHSC